MRGRPSGRPGRARVALLGLTLAAVAGGCQAHEPVRPAAAAPNPAPAVVRASDGDQKVPWELLITFGEVERGEPAEVFSNAGTARLEIEAVTWGGGQVTSVGGRNSRAARLPAHRVRDPQYAVIRVRNARDEDALSPGDLDFSFGADVAIDPVTTGSDGDDGDNVLQRGLYEGSGQYKIQVDDGVPSCRVRGLTGEVVLIARGRPLVPEEWYRIRCTRTGRTVTMDVGRLPDDPGGPVEWTSSSRTAQLGAVMMPGDMPFSVGGKLSDDGAILPSSTDQFNGRIDRVFYTLVR